MHVHLAVYMYFSLCLHVFFSLPACIFLADILFIRTIIYNYYSHACMYIRKRIEPIYLFYMAVLDSYICEHSIYVAYSIYTHVYVLLLCIIMCACV